MQFAQLFQLVPVGKKSSLSVGNTKDLPEAPWEIIITHAGLCAANVS